MRVRTEADRWGQLEGVVGKVHEYLVAVSRVGLQPICREGIAPSAYWKGERVRPPRPQNYHKADSAVTHLDQT